MDRSAVQAYMNECGILTMVYYAKLVHVQGAFVGTRGWGRRMPKYGNITGEDAVPANSFLFDGGRDGNGGRCSERGVGAI